MGKYICPRFSTWVIQGAIKINNKVVEGPVLHHTTHRSLWCFIQPLYPVSKPTFFSMVQPTSMCITSNPSSQAYLTILPQGLSWTHHPYHHPQYPSMPHLTSPQYQISHIQYLANSSTMYPTTLHPERYATSFSRVQPSPFWDAFNLSIQPKLPHPSSGSSPVSSASHATVSPPTSLTSCCEIYPSQFSIPSPSSFSPK